VTYFGDVAALTRKDLLLELRAKETLPAMLLFVLSALTIFHFALPRGTDETASLGLLWSALIFTALLGLTRAFVAEREQGMFDALILTPADRSAIWLAKTLSVLAFLVAAEVVAGRARELLLPLLFLPTAIPIVVGGVGGYLWFLALYDAIFAVLSWAAFEYVVAET
jgi:ABC-type transport system involved in cytochrome c biogenesis permease component